jgi:hypothetical protein
LHVPINKFDVEMDVFEKEGVLEKKLDVEMDVFVLEKKL